MIYSFQHAVLDYQQENTVRFMPKFKLSSPPKEKKEKI
jgi:hypothetical protein